MADVSAHDLQRRTADVLARVEAGERIRVCADGRPVAELVPVGVPRWVSGSAIESLLRAAPADAGLLSELATVRGPNDPRA